MIETYFSMKGKHIFIRWCCLALLVMGLAFLPIQPAMAGLPTCTDLSRCGDDSFSDLPYNVEQLQITDSLGNVINKNYSLLDTSKLSLSRFPPLNVTPDLLTQIQSLSPDVIGQMAGQYGLTSLNGLTGKLANMSDLMPISMAMGALDLPMSQIFNLSKQFGVGTVVNGFLQPSATLPNSLESLSLNGLGISMLPIQNIINGVSGLADLSLSKAPAIAALAGVAGLGNVLPDSDLSSITVGQTLKLLPSMGALPLNVLDPTQTISNLPPMAQSVLGNLNITNLAQVSQFIPSNLINLSGGNGVFPSIDPRNLTLSSFSVSSIPELVNTPLASIQGAEQLPISSIPGLKDIPVSKLPIPLIAQSGTKLGLVDIVFEKAEHQLPQPDHVISGTLPDPSNNLTKVLCPSRGCSGMEIHQLDAPDFKGYHWMDDSYTGQDGFGPACLPFGCKGPVGNHPYGLAARVAISSPSEANGRLQTKLYFHACWTIPFVGYTCTPYALPAGGLPFVTYNEKDAFLFLPPGSQVTGNNYNYPNYKPNTCSTSGSAIAPSNLDALSKAVFNASSAARGISESGAAQAIPLIIKECSRYGVTDSAKLSYVLASTLHESDGYSTMNEYGKPNYDSCGYGRGYIQLTWCSNYQKAADLLGIPDLATNPDLATDPKVAADIACGGMKNGMFTGVGLSDYLPSGSSPDFTNARKIVNDNDKSSLIADYAKTIQAAIDGVSNAPSNSQNPATPASIPTVASVCSSNNTGTQAYAGKPINGWCDPLPDGIQTHPFGEYPHGGPPAHVHGGIDIAGVDGATVYAAADGVVVDVEGSCSIGDMGCGGGYGNLVVLQHTGDRQGFFTLYGHNARPMVSIGDRVTCGQAISIQGTTGASFGDHSHFEVKTSQSSGVLSPKSVGVPNMQS
ncbi:MAG: peptidoglycan DD-metalloendopeptidase family protein [Pseudanabaena sp. M38BS1SP1A06MG]|nr:peptidoglycan DD-metalloendopeptidase family protein [Pseudanabaena sp. M38BS1SP1A06MG]